MIALVASLFFLFYVFVPGSIFRFATSLAIPLKKFQKTKTQEITFAVLASLLPFCLTLALVWGGGWREVDWPFPTRDTDAQRQGAYQTVFSGLVSNQQLDDSLAKGKFWPAVTDVGRRQSRFLFWYYVFMMLEAWIFWYLVSRYKKLQGRGWYDAIAAHFLLPSISEWHVILSSFAIKTDDEKNREIELDLLSTDNILYRGKLIEYFTNAEGELSGVLLQRAYRFDRENYVEDRKAQHDPSKQDREQKIVKDKESYWRKIPGADLFYIPKERISNFNVRHEKRPISPATPAAIKAILAERGVRQVTISEKPPEKSKP